MSNRKPKSNKAVSTVAIRSADLAHEMNLPEAMKLEADYRNWETGYYAVSAEFAYECCKFDEYEKRQRRNSDEARRATDGLLHHLQSTSRIVLVQLNRSKSLRVVAEYTIGQDQSRNLVIIGPVPLSGNAKKEEVRAYRRLILAMVRQLIGVQDCTLVALTTEASGCWGDHEILNRMGYNADYSLTAEGNDWLTAITNGAEVGILCRPSNTSIVGEVASGELEAKAISLDEGAEINLSSDSKFSLRFWHKRK